MMKNMTERDDYSRSVDTNKEGAGARAFLLVGGQRAGTHIHALTHLQTQLITLEEFFIPCKSTNNGVCNFWDLYLELPS